MSIEKTSQQDASARLAKRNLEIDKAVDTRQRPIELVEVTSLEIDESYDGDCDPYNCTGQFLVGALKQQHDD